MLAVLYLLLKWKKLLGIAASGVAGVKLERKAMRKRFIQSGGEARLEIK